MSVYHMIMCDCIVLLSSVILCFLSPLCSPVCLCFEVSCESPLMSYHGKPHCFVGSGIPSTYKQLHIRSDQKRSSSILYSEVFNWSSVRRPQPALQLIHGEAAATIYGNIYGTFSSQRRNLSDSAWWFTQPLLLELSSMCLAAIFLEDECPLES